MTDPRICACGEEIGPFTIALDPNAKECSDCSGRSAHDVARDLAAKAAATNNPGGTPRVDVDAIRPPLPEAAPIAPHATEEHQESKGAALQPAATGDRAKGVEVPAVVDEMARQGGVSFLLEALHKRHSANQSIRVEWWVYAVTGAGEEAILGKYATQWNEAVSFSDTIAGTTRLVSNWRELDLYAFTKYAESPKVHRFKVILQWQADRDLDDSQRFDIGGTFAPRSSARADIAAALNAATAYAKCEAARLGLPVHVWSFYPARGF